jgi:hypothetical protein
LGSISSSQGGAAGVWRAYKRITKLAATSLFFSLSVEGRGVVEGERRNQKEINKEEEKLLVRARFSFRLAESRRRRRRVCSFSSSSSSLSAMMQALARAWLH